MPCWEAIKAAVIQISNVIYFVTLNSSHRVLLSCRIVKSSIYTYLIVMCWVGSCVVLWCVVLLGFAMFNLTTLRPTISWYVVGFFTPQRVTCIANCREPRILFCIDQWHIVKPWDRFATQIVCKRFNKVGFKRKLNTICRKVYFFRSRRRFK